LRKRVRKRGGSCEKWTFFRSAKDLTAERKSSFSIEAQLNAKGSFGIKGVGVSLSTEIGAKYNTKTDSKYNSLAQQKGEILVSKVIRTTSICMFLGNVSMSVE